MRRPAIVLLTCLALLGAACSDDSATSSGTSAAPVARDDVVTGGTDPDVLSIVVIGDSVASGEGIAYGYTYDYDAEDPDESAWTGGTEDPTWQGEYPLCHDDAEAYGDLVAQALDARLAKFACTGASYLNGITTAETVSSGSGPIQQTMRPAQFGNWTTGEELNPAYDAAEPDVVVLTFGADDVHFVDIIEYCVLGFEPGDAQDQAIADSDDPRAAIDAALAQRLPELVAARAAGDTSAGDESSASVCTAGNAGATIDKLFWEPINNGEIADHYQSIVSAIQARGNDPAYGDGKVPEIVFTTYHQPLPAGLDGDCWDVWPLSSAEQQYLQSLQDTLQSTLESAVKDLEGVTIADISGTMDGHEWCSEDPWAYGLSIINQDVNVESQAPFHPTPEGQAAIAAIVESSIRSVTGR